MSVLARATDWPEVEDVGGGVLPLRRFAVSISVWLSTSGCLELTLMSYLAANASMTAP